MDGGLLSRTSQAVALTRAAMSRPHTEQGDPDAQRRLRHGATEPWLTVLPAADWRRLLGETGWLIDREADPRAGSGAEGRSLLVVAQGSRADGVGDAGRAGT